MPQARFLHCGAIAKEHQSEQFHWQRRPRFSAALRGAAHLIGGKFDDVSFTQFQVNELLLRNDSHLDGDRIKERPAGPMVVESSQNETTTCSLLITRRRPRRRACAARRGGNLPLPLGDAEWPGADDAPVLRQVENEIVTARELQEQIGHVPLGLNHQPFAGDRGNSLRSVEALPRSSHFSRREWGAIVKSRAWTHAEPPALPLRVVLPGDGQRGLWPAVLVEAY